MFRENGREGAPFKVLFKAPPLRSFTIQIKAFTRRDEAKAYAEEVADALQRQYPMFIIEASRNNRPLFRVRMGFFRSRAEGKSARQKFIDRFGREDRPFVTRQK